MSPVNTPMLLNFASPNYERVHLHVEISSRLSSGYEIFRPRNTFPARAWELSLSFIFLVRLLLCNLVRPIWTVREFDRDEMKTRNYECFSEILANLASPDLLALSFSVVVAPTFTWRAVFIFIRSLAVQGLNVVQHDTTPFSTVSRIFRPSSDSPPGAFLSHPSVSPDPPPPLFLIAPARGSVKTR